MGAELATGLVTLHNRLREMILSGEIEPGSPVSQVRLAEQLGVSRTPLREVLRMLQQEGLVIAETNRRVRVVEFNVTELEYIYTQRLLLEPLALALTIKSGNRRYLEDIESALENLFRLVDEEDRNVWEKAHRRFHLSLGVGAPRSLMDATVRYQDLAAGARRLYSTGTETARARRHVGLRDHESVVKACRDWDWRTAVDRLADHLARTPLTLIAELAVGHEPVMLRSTLQIVCARVGEATKQATSTWST